MGVQEVASAKQQMQAAMQRVRSYSTQYQGCRVVGLLHSVWLASCGTHWWGILHSSHSFDLAEDVA